jgi:hypothetical protein
MAVLRRLLVGLVLIAGPMDSRDTLWADEPILTVKVTSGRHFQGVVDAHSTEDHLVLRSDANGITIRRPIRWERIARGSLAGSSVALAQIEKLARDARVRQQETGDRRQGGNVKKIEMRDVVSPMPTADTEAAMVVTPPRQAAAVGFDALVANWDADVETDGLVLDIAPLDASGYLIPADGTLQVELFAPRRVMLHNAPHTGGDTMELVERWTQSLSAADCGLAGWRVRLPFGTVHPDFDINRLASSYGLVHVQLVLPGHGVFEDSRDGVRIRPWAPNRDRLETETGRRFLPTERVGRQD